MLGVRGQRVIELAPARGLTAGGQVLDDVAQVVHADAEGARLGQVRGGDSHEARHVQRAQQVGVLAGSPGQRAGVAGGDGSTVGVAKHVRAAERLQRRGAQTVVQVRGGQLEGDEVEELRGRGTAVDQLAGQLAVGLAGGGDDGVGGPAGGDPTPARVHREGRHEQRGHRGRLVGGCGGVDDARPVVAALPRERPRHPPAGAGAVLEPAVGQRLGRQLALPGDEVPPAGDVVEAARRLPRPLEGDGGQPGQGEQQGVVQGAEPSLDPPGGACVPQPQGHRGVEAGRWGGVRSERQPQDRQLRLARDGRLRHARVRARVRGTLGDGGRGFLEDEAHRTGGGRDRDVVGNGADRSEADAEPAHRTHATAVVRAGLRGGTHTGQGGDAVRPQGRTGVRGEEHGPLVVGAQAEQEVTSRAGGGCGVGRVLRELDEHPVAVVPGVLVLLEVGVLAQAGGRGGPGGQCRLTQRGGAERVCPTAHHGTA